MKLPIVVVLVLALTSRFLSPGAAQQSDRPGQVHLRNDCRLAAQILSNGNPSTKRAWAWATIGNCAEAGPPILADLWATSADSASVRLLLNASSRIRDRRLVEAVFRAAVTPSNTTLVRLSAMVLVVRYADPHIRPVVSLVPSPPPGWTPDQSVRVPPLPRVDHAPQEDGPEPLRADFPTAAVELLEGLRQDHDLRVAYAASIFAATLHREVQTASGH